MPTELLFRDNAYLRECTARVIGVSPAGGIILDRTVFYATSGGQPGDQGVLVTDAGESIPVAGAIHSDAAKTEVEHILAEGTRPPQAGEPVTARLDWSLRYPRMRMHTALHLLSAALPYPVTGGSIGNLEGRLDFDIPDAGLDKDAINTKLAEMIATDAEVRTRWISEEELAANPSLIKTMSVKPPTGAGRVRLVEVFGLDLQPCGGTHVARTSEIGSVRVSQIEKKGKLNRRVRLVFAEESEMRLT